MSEDSGATLLLAIYIPGHMPDLQPDDAELYADVFVGVVNEERVRNGGADEVGFDTPAVEPVEVSAIPAPQWLTPETLARLREPRATALLASGWRIVRTSTCQCGMPDSEHFDGVHRLDAYPCEEHIVEEYPS